MKTILVKISDKVFKELDTSINIRGMTGSYGGATDEFVRKLVLAIREDQQELCLSLKEEKDGNSDTSCSNEERDGDSIS